MTSTSSFQTVWAKIFVAAATRFPRYSPLLLGGRGSAKSMAQLEAVSAKLKHTVPGIGARIASVKVGAETSTDRPPVVGGKTDNIDAALLSGDVHAAVHCEKDLDGESVYASCERLVRRANQITATRGPAVACRSPYAAEPGS